MGCGCGCGCAAEEGCGRGLSDCGFDATGCDPGRQELAVTLATTAALASCLNALLAGAKPAAVKAVKEGMPDKTWEAIRDRSGFFLITHAPIIVSLLSPGG